MNPSVLKVSGLTKSFNQTKAIQGISFQLEPGNIYGLLGPNGAGKTTTLKILAGLLSHDDGTIAIDGSLYSRDNSRLKQLISYVPDQPFVYSKLTGEEHMHFFADLYKVPESVRKERFDFYFSYFEFESFRHELVETYSAGTKQKLLISQAFMVEPKILLLDEPLVSIDPLVARKFKKYLVERASDGLIVLFATHILSLAHEVSSRIGIILSGRIIKEGSADDLMALSNTSNLEDLYFQTVLAHEDSAEN